MKPNLENWTLVIVGQWNARIFSPKWAAEKILKQGEIKVELAVSSNAPIIRLHTDDLVLIPLDDRIILGAKGITDDILRKVEVIARTTLELLPHTPVTALGINFAFNEENLSPDLLSLFETKDQRELSDFGFKLTKTELSRQLKLDDKTINLSHIYQEGILEVKLNFHHDIGSATQANGLLENRVIEYRDMAYSLLNNVYKLTLEEDPERDTNN